MRIQANRRTGATSARSGVSQAADGGEFRLGEADAVARPMSAPTVSGSAGIGALLALQVVGDATEGRRRAVQRGRTLLDTLEEMRADLLAGRVSPAALDRLTTVIGQSREAATPQIDTLLDDIELRVRVELAKQGRFPAF